MSAALRRRRSVGSVLFTVVRFLLKFNDAVLRSVTSGRFLFNDRIDIARRLRRRECRNLDVRSFSLSVFIRRRKLLSALFCVFIRRRNDARNDVRASEILGPTHFGIRSRGPHHQVLGIFFS